MVVTERHPLWPSWSGMYITERHPLWTSWSGMYVTECHPLWTSLSGMYVTERHPLWTSWSGMYVTECHTHFTVRHVSHRTPPFVGHNPQLGMCVTEHQSLCLEYILIVFYLFMTFSYPYTTFTFTSITPSSFYTIYGHAVLS